MPHRVRSARANHRCLAPGLHSSKKTSQRWRAVGETVSELTDRGIEQDNDVSNHCASRPLLLSAYILTGKKLF